MSRPSAPGPPSPSHVHERKLLHRFEPAVTCSACQPSCSTQSNTQSGTVSTEAEALRPERTGYMRTRYARSTVQ